jgi:hypothetical protein
MLMNSYVDVALELERSGLVWEPEIGDEVLYRQECNRVSILVDSRGLTSNELRATFIWLPTLEQLIEELEAREAVIYHAGKSKQENYEALIKTSLCLIEEQAESLRLVFAQALRKLIGQSHSEQLH